jgi:L-aspartate oxidase
VRKRDNIQILTKHTAIDLITFPHHAKDPFAIYRDPICLGAYVFDQEKKTIFPIVARYTVLSTGGLGRIYLNTTNPPGIRGDGIAMAYRVGARIINAEYAQFHPTALYTRCNTRFLISEAVRGEGARLLTPDGQPFMEKYAPEWKDLALRDNVTRAIYWEMLSRDYPYVLLDLASTKSPADIKKRFPQIYQNCLMENVNISREPIPVVPAAHYFCGGVQVDLYGRSIILGLYAIGEVSCTGVHGANRLASTSLLEGVVWGRRAADHFRVCKEVHPFRDVDTKPWSLEGLIYEPDPALIQGDLKNLQNLMWHYVGLVRNNYRMKRADRDLRYLRHGIEDFYRKTTLSDDLIGLRNAIQAAQIVTYAAIRNRSSRGAHYRED